VKRTALLHAELSQVIASLGHGDMLVLGDAGLPIPDGPRRSSMSPTSGLLSAVAGSMSGIGQRAQGFTGRSVTGRRPVAMCSASTRSSSCASMPDSTMLGRKRSMPTAWWPAARAARSARPASLAGHQHRVAVAELVGRLAPPVHFRLDRRWWSGSKRTSRSGARGNR
jgi:hypothetical protein